MGTNGETGLRGPNQTPLTHQAGRDLPALLLEERGSPLAGDPAQPVPAAGAASWRRPHTPPALAAGREAAPGPSTA